VADPVLTQEKLRAIVRELVIEAIQRISSHPAADAATSKTGKTVGVVFVGSAAPHPSVIAQVAALVNQFGLAVFFSESFRVAQSTDAVMQALPKHAARYDQSAERVVLTGLQSCAALIVAGLSTNTAAKCATGIEDSVPSVCILQALRSGKPVCFSAEISSIAPQLQREYPAIPPALVRIYEDHFHRLQQMGVHFVAPQNVAGCVKQFFEVPRNETPERLAKKHPSPKRQFITVEDVWSAFSRGQKQILHSRSAVITDEARDYAAQNGVELRPE
jgi:hypothetical protein